MAKSKIPGGYYMKARCIQNSDIAKKPPYVREIWDWLLKEANHSDNKSNGKIIKRGQLITTFKKIKDGLSWEVGYRKMSYKKWQIEKTMIFLREATMIATTKTTRGIVVTVINYDFYQTPANYNGQREQQREQQSTDTINKNVLKNVKKKDIVEKNLHLTTKIIEYLNNKIGTQFRATTYETANHINGRISEGRTLEDFYSVIDKKVAQWKDDKKMRKFLRPNTLFCESNFESYLNEDIETEDNNYLEKQFIDLRKEMGL